MVLKEKGQLAGKYVFFAAFVVIITLTFFIGLTRVGCYNTDAIVEMNYAQLVWEQKSIFPDGWHFTTETFIHRPFFFPALIYGVTGNFFLSYVSGLMAGVLLFSAIAYGYFRFLKLSRAAVFFGLCCLCSLFVHWVFMFDLIGYYYSGIFGSVMLTIWAYQSHEKLLRYLALISAVMMGMASLRMVVLLYAPLLALGLFNIMQERHKGKRADFQDFFYVLKLMFGNVMGYIFLVHVVKKYFHTNWGTAHLEIYSSASEYLGAIATAGQRVWEVLQLSEPVMFLLFVISVFVAVKIFISVSNVRYKQALMFFLFSLASVFVASCMLKEMNGAARYYLPITFFVILALMFLLDDMIKVRKYRHITIVLGLATVLYGMHNCQWVLLRPGVFPTDHEVADSLITKYPEAFKSAHLQADLHEVANYLKEQDIERVYATFWYAGPIKLFSQGSIETGYFDMNLAPYLWGTDMNLYVPGEYTSPVAVVLQKDELGNLSESGRDILRQGKFMKEIKGEYLVYYFDSNPILLR